MKKWRQTSGPHQDLLSHKMSPGVIPYARPHWAPKNYKKTIRDFRPKGHIAQLVEREDFNPCDIGSNPIMPSTQR